jgi:Mg2+-importing ATPase
MALVLSTAMMVLSIRTHKPILHSKPSRALLSATIAIVIITLLLPYTPLAGLLGFQALPIEFRLVLAALVGLYILCAETVKRVFYQHVQI